MIWLPLAASNNSLQSCMTTGTSVLYDNWNFSTGNPLKITHKKRCTMGYICRATSVAWYLWAPLVGSVMWQNPEVLSSIIQGGGSEKTVKAFQRTLLADDSTPGTTAQHVSIGVDTGVDTGSNSGTWPYLLAALLTMLSVSLFIVVVVKCRLYERYLASYRHVLLPEGDTVSQYDPRGLEVGFAPQSVMERVPPRHFHIADDGDDDGFIEDNYIQAGGSGRAEREREQERHAGDESDTDDDLDLDQFSIG